MECYSRRLIIYIMTNLMLLYVELDNINVKTPICMHTLKPCALVCIVYINIKLTKKNHSHINTTRTSAHMYIISHSIQTSNYGTIHISMY